MGRASAASLIVCASLCAALSSCSKQEPPAAKVERPSLPATARLLASLDSAAKPARPVKIGIVTNAVAPFWNAMVVGMQHAEREWGCDASWAGPPTGQVVEQKRLIESMVAKGVDGLSVSPIDPESMGPALDEVAAEGVHVITMDSDAANSKRLLYIGTNNYNAGREAGRQAVKLLGPDGGKVVAFVGNMAAQNAQDRLKGFKDATKDHKIEVVEVREDQTDQNRARRNVEEILQAYPKIDLLLGLWAYNGPAIVAALKDAGKRDAVRVVSFDAEPATLEYLKKGELEVTIVQKPYLFGYLSVAVLYSMRAQGVEATLKLLPENRIVDTGVEAITPANVQEYLQRLAKLGIQSS